MVDRNDSRDVADIHTIRDAQTLTRIRAALDGLRYGEVVVKVQDGVVVQVERTERMRWNNGSR
jgi:hypothetical protein